MNLITNVCVYQDLTHYVLYGHVGVCDVTTHTSVSSSVSLPLTKNARFFLAPKFDALSLGFSH